MKNRTVALMGLGLLLIGFMFASRDLSANKEGIAADPAISGRFVGAGFGAPLDADFTGLPGDERVFVTEKGGSIRIMGEPYGSPFFDISEKVARSNEKGMLGMVFDPDFATNKYFYVFYTGPFDETVDPPTFITRIERYTVSDNPNFADLSSGLTILELEQQSQFHNGGNMIFGPDGYLYVGIGDDNVRRLSQDLNSLNGKVLRLDTDPNRGLPPDCDLVSGNYSIPADNPFVNQDACGEVWAYGLRNPWRFSFDTETNDFFLGDVGDESFEEINWASASSNGGENYGWPYFEGTDCVGGVFAADCAATTNHALPIYAYPHSNGGGSVTGGFVYRGSRYPNLVGHYVFADFTNSVLTTAILDNNSWQFTEHGPMLTEGAPLISSFGQDPTGEIFAVRITDGNPVPGQSTGSLWQVIDEYGFEIEIEAPDSVAEGEAIEYTLTITNVGSQAIANVQIENQIPAGVTHQSGGLVSGDSVTWNIPSLAAEESTVVKWTAMPFQASITNSVYQVSASGEPPVVGRDSVTTTTTVPPVGVGGRLFQDYNQNGLDDDFELGVEGIVVKLWNDSDCDGQIQSGGLLGLVESEADGSYFFNLENADQSNCYLIKLELGDLPAAVQLTAQNVGSDDSIDSDFFPNGWMEKFTIPVEPVSAGFTGFTTVPPPTATPSIVPTTAPTDEVFGRVFVDQNGNGLDDGEPGIPNVEVTLYRDSDCDGEVVGGDIYRRTNTPNSGVYVFSVEDSSGCFLFKANPNDLPAGWIFTQRNVGSNDAIDNDVYAFGWTDVFRLPIEAVSAGAYDPAVVTPAPIPTETSTPTLIPTPEPLPTLGPGEFPPTSTPIPVQPPTIGPDYVPIFMPIIAR